MYLKFEVLWNIWIYLGIGGFFKILCSKIDDADILNVEKIDSFPYF
jgi:hypothetical protein